MTPTQTHAAQVLTDAETDQHLDAVLNGAGSALRHYTTEFSLSRMRAAMREHEAAILAKLQPAQEAAQEEPTLRDYADSLIEAGHDFWKACKREAGGGAVRWMSCDDGTLIVFTRGEYRDTIMENIGGYKAPEVFFEDDGITAAEAQEPAQSIPPGLRVGDSHMESLIEAAIQGHAGTRDAMRWLVRQIARVEAKPAQAGELPAEHIPSIGCGFWIDKISVSNLRHIHRSESATAMISALINATDAIEDAQALIATLRSALAARKPLTWRTVIPGGKRTDEWDSARVGDYNAGWNAYRKAAQMALEKICPLESISDDAVDAKCLTITGHLLSRRDRDRLVWRMAEEHHGINGLEVKT